MTVPQMLLIIIPLGLLLAGVVAAWRFAVQRIHSARQRLIIVADQLEDQEELQARISALRALSEVAYDALILVDEQRRILHMNVVARNLFGYTSNLPPDPTGTLIAITRSHELDAIVGDVLENNEPITLQLDINSSTYRVQAQQTRSGDQRFVALALEDVSELQRLGRARRDMVANVSHELRTPITSIRLLVDTLLRDEPPGKKRRKKLLTKIAAETDTLQQMAQELLDLSMIESGRAEFIMNQIELGTVVNNAMEHFSEQARRKSLTFSADIPADITVLADASQVERVVSNLLHNAIKFTPDEGNIQISARTVGAEWARLCVTDTGPGIIAEDRPRIFERFYRADRARRGAGTGLGLAIAKHIIHAHGGDIWVDDPPGDDPLSPGARICFTLPLYEE